MQLKQDPTYFMQADQTLAQALQISPKRQQIQYMLAGLELQLGKKDQAIKLLQDSVDNDSLIGEGWWRLAAFYQQAGDMASAKKTIQEALTKGIKFDDQGNQVVGMIMGTTTKK